MSFHEFTKSQPFVIYVSPAVYCLKRSRYWSVTRGKLLVTYENAHEKFVVCNYEGPVVLVIYEKSVVYGASCFLFLGYESAVVCYFRKPSCLLFTRGQLNSDRIIFTKKTKSPLWPVAGHNLIAFYVLMR